MNRPEASDTLPPDVQSHIDRLFEDNRRRTAAEYESCRVDSVESLGIVGAGSMGAAIAAAAIRHNLSVMVTDTSPQALAGLPQQVAARWDGELEGDRPIFAAQKSGQSPSCLKGQAAIKRLLQTSEDPAAIARCDLVIESVVEDPAIKQQVLGRLEANLAERTVLSSNTSTIPIARLASKLAEPGRFCGLHFFLPASERAIVEVIRGPRSSRDTLAVAAAFAEAVGHTPLLVDDQPGFLVNRLMLPYLSEATQLLLEGVPIESIERAATSFGMSIGPLALLDLIGLDTILDCAWALSATSDDLVPHSPLLVSMVKSRRLGRKCGAGFFSYDDDNPAGRPDPAVEQIIAKWATPAQIPGEETITARLILPMLLEATRIIERTGCEPGLVDLAAMYGFGFPTFRGGLLYWADEIGAAHAVEMLRPLENEESRMEPTPLLLQMARENGRFFPSRKDSDI